MKKLVAIVAVCVLASLGLMLWGFHGGGGAGSAVPPRYAMLATLDRGTVILQLKQGAQQAADEAGAALVVHTMEPDIPAEAQLVAAATALVQGGIDGILLPPCAPETLAEIHAIAQAKGVPLVCLWMEDARADGFVTADLHAQGVLLAGAVGRPDAIYAAMDAQNDARVEGIRATLGDDMPPVLRDLQAVEALPDGAVLLVTGAALTQEAATLAGGRLALWGIDPGDARVQLLEEGLACGLVMDMPYAQGYQAIALLDSLHRGDGDAARFLRTQSRMVTQDVMYDPENVKLVFPLLQ